MATMVSPAGDLMAWVSSLPAVDKSIAELFDGRPTLPSVPGWTLHLFQSGNLWKITGRRGCIVLIVDRLSAAQVNAFDPNGR